MNSALYPSSLGHIKSLATQPCVRYSHWAHHRLRHRRCLEKKLTGGGSPACSPGARAFAKSCDVLFRSRIINICLCFHFTKEKLFFRFCGHGISLENSHCMKRYMAFSRRRSAAEAFPVPSASTCENTRWDEICKWVVVWFIGFEWALFNRLQFHSSMLMGKIIVSFLKFSQCSG